MNRHRLLTALFAGAAIAAATAVAVAEPAPWDPPPVIAGLPEDVYCARLLAWHNTHPDAPEIDGWPDHCRATYPDRTLTGRINTTTTSSSTTTTTTTPVATPGFTG